MIGIVIVGAIILIGYFVINYVALKNEVQQKETAIEVLKAEKDAHINGMEHEYRERAQRDREILEKEKHAFLNSTEPIIAEKAKYYGFLISELSDTLDRFHWFPQIYDLRFPQFFPQQVNKDVFDEKFPNAFGISFLLTVKAIYNTSDHIFNPYQIDEELRKEDTQYILIPAIKVFSKSIINIPIADADIIRMVDCAYDNVFKVKSKTYQLDEKSDGLWEFEILERCAKILFIYWIHHSLSIPLDVAAQQVLEQNSLFSDTPDHMRVASNGNAYLRNYARIKSIVIKEMQQTKEGEQI